MERKPPNLSQLVKAGVTLHSFTFHPCVWSCMRSFRAALCRHRGLLVGFDVLEILCSMCGASRGIVGWQGPTASGAAHIAAGIRLSEITRTAPASGGAVGLHDPSVAFFSHPSPWVSAGGGIGGVGGWWRWSDCGGVGGTAVAIDTPQAGVPEEWVGWMQFRRFLTVLGVHVEAMGDQGVGWGCRDLSSIKVTSTGRSPPTLP